MNQPRNSEICRQSASFSDEALARSACGVRRMASNPIKRACQDFLNCIYGAAGETRMKFLLPNMVVLFAPCVLGVD